jgi:hypothetical protein
MTNNDASSRQAGVSALGLLWVVLVFLKLNPGDNFDTPIADWSWWLILGIPFIYAGIMIIVMLVFLLAVAIWSKD